MRKILLSFVLIQIFILTGCGEGSPIKKLQDNKRNDDMTNIFWVKEHEANTDLWKKAVSYCKDHNEKPNCAPVMQVYVISNGSTKVPAYGTSGNTLTLPNFK